MTDELRRKLKQAQWRLNASRALRVGTWTTTIALVIATLVAAADQLFGLGIGWPVILLSAVLASTAAALAIAVWKRSRPLDAAAAIDHAWNLKERLSTLVSIPEDQRAHEAAHALAHDVEDRTGAIHVAERLPVVVPKRAWVPVVPLILFVFAVAAIPSLRPNPKLDAKETSAEERARVEEQARELSKRAEERRQEIKKEGLSDELVQLTSDIDKASSELAKNPRVKAEDAAVKLGDLAREIEKRQENGSLDRMKRALANLPNAKEGPASKLQKALRQGDFKEAAKQMKDLREQLEKGDVSKEQKQQLAQQLSKMEEQLKKAANMAERAKQIEKGLSPQDAKEQLARLEKQTQDLKKLDELAQKMGSCSECMGGKEKSDKEGSKDGEEGQATQGKQGQGKAGSENGEEADVKKLSDELKDAERLLRELAQEDMNQEMLNRMMDDLDQCRQQMLCQGEGEANGQRLGRGRGRGDRPEQEGDTRGRETRAKSQTTNGKSFISGRTEGPLLGGQSKAELREAVSSAARQADEAITRQPVPADYKDHTREYFERLHGQMKDEN